MFRTKQRLNWKLPVQAQVKQKSTIIDGLIDWLIDCLIVRLIDWLIGLIFSPLLWLGQSTFILQYLCLNLESDRFIDWLIQVFWSWVMLLIGRVLQLQTGRKSRFQFGGVCGVQGPLLPVLLRAIHVAWLSVEKKKPRLTPKYSCSFHCLRRDQMVSGNGSTTSDLVGEPEGRTDADRATINCFYSFDFHVLVIVKDHSPSVRRIFAFLLYAIGEIKLYKMKIDRVPSYEHPASAEPMSRLDNGLDSAKHSS